MPPALPDFDTSFVNESDIAAFERAINAPDAAADGEDPSAAALDEWRSVRLRVRRRHSRHLRLHRRRGAGSGGGGGRGKDETREGFIYALAKWPLLVLGLAWLVLLALLYVLTRFYIAQYEYWITWRGRRNALRRHLRASETYEQWKGAAQQLDAFLGAERWKEEDAFAYYDHATVRRLLKDLGSVRERAEAARTQRGGAGISGSGEEAGRAEAEELRALIEACVKNNFAGIESDRMYSQTYYGTKHLVQSFVDELERCLAFLCKAPSLPAEDKRELFKRLASNYGRTALCLSGGACFSYYHLGVVKALLDAALLPRIITGTSGGALVAALVCTRTDAELAQLLVPELAAKITACQDGTLTWLRRWLRTGARFDAVDWARRCCWFTRGSTTFREAYQRTGRVLNISCVPADAHSPTLLLNHVTAPDCCIFSAVLASAAVPGILHPVVLMARPRAGPIVPYSFGHKWKDGSLRTDIPLRSLNLHFAVNFTIVSQVNPHVTAFFFASRGAVGRPVTHRRGRGWRGGFLGSAAEKFLKLDMAKWLKVLRHLELLPRPLSQDWGAVFLQKFDGTVTLWPRTVPSDFWYILSDPTPARLARMLLVGQRCAFPSLKFLENRLKIERMVEHGRNLTRSRISDDVTDEVVSSRLPWAGGAKSPRRASADGTVADEGLRLRRASNPGGGDGAAVPLEVDWGRDSTNVDADEEEEGEEDEWGSGGSSDGGSSSSSNSSAGGEAEAEGAGEEWDATGGRMVPPGEPVPKISARGETILGV